MMSNFLNNLWVAVSTPNPLLLKILSVPMSFLLEVPLSLYLIISIFNIQVNRKKKLCYILSTGAISNICTLFIPSPFNVIITYLAMFLIIHFTFKTNAVKTILAGLLPTFVFTIVQNLLFNPYITLLNITFEQFMSIVIYKVPLSLIIYVIVFVLAYIIKIHYKELYFGILDAIDEKSKKLIIANLVFGLAYIILEIAITMKYLNILPLTYTFANFTMLLLYFIITLYSISKIIKLQTATTQLESAEEYNKTLKILHDNVRGFKHDFDNIVTTIGGYINTNDMEGLKKYYVQL